MKHNMYLLNAILAVVLGVALLAVTLLRTFAPWLIIPAASIPMLVLISVIALVLEHYLAQGAERCYICIPLLSALTFILLPWAAGYYADAMSILKLALIGTITFTAVTWLFTSAVDRMSSGPKAKSAPVITALCLVFASQCLTGIIL